MTRRVLSGFAMAVLTLSAVPAAARQPSPAQQAPGTPQSAAVPAAAGTLRTALQGRDAAMYQAFADQKLQQGIKRTLIEAAVADPMTTSAQAAAEHQVTVVAEKGDVLGRARFYLPLGPQADAQVTFAAPLTSGAATFATGDGLAPKAQANVALKYVIWSKTMTVSQDGLTRFGSLIAGSASPATALAAIELLRRSASEGGADAAALTSVVVSAGPNELDPAIRRLLTSPTLVRSADRFYAALAQADPELVSTKYAVYLLPGLEWNRRTFEYLAADSLAKEKYDESGRLFTFSAGMSKIADWRTDPEGKPQSAPVFYAGVSFRGGDAVDVGDPRDVCHVEGASGAIECFNLPVGAPLESTLRALTVELRQWTPAQTIGINPRYTYSRKRPGDKQPSTVHTLEVPVYFMRKVKDISVPSIDFGADLIGGVNVGWRNTGTAEGPFIALFMSKAFGMP